MSGTTRLPAGMRVIVRDWLSANHVLLADRDEAVMIDTGYGARLDDTRALLAAPDALGARRLDRIVNTHAHSDHVGGNAALAREHGCRIEVPAGEARAIAAWDETALLLAYADQRCERFSVDATLAAGDRPRLGGFDFLALGAPGHATHALAFYSPEHRILISSDALWENGFGFVPPNGGGLAALAEAQATLEQFARLPIELVIPGHGRPFVGAQAAIERSLRRIEQFRRDPLRLARYALKAFFMFRLLETGRFVESEVAGYVARVPLYRDIVAEHFPAEAPSIAATLIEELAQAGALRREAGMLHPL